MDQARILKSLYNVTYFFRNCNSALTSQNFRQIVNAIIHLANKDYTALVDDFIALGILPQDCDRPKVIPLMDKALSPYVSSACTAWTAARRAPWAASRP